MNSHYPRFISLDIPEINRAKIILLAVNQKRAQNGKFRLKISIYFSPYHLSGRLYYNTVHSIQQIFTNHKFIGAVAIICRGDPDLEKREKEYIDTYANPFPAAKKGYDPIMHYTCGFEESEDNV